MGNVIGMIQNQSKSVHIKIKFSVSNNFCRVYFFLSKKLIFVGFTESRAKSFGLGYMALASYSHMYSLGLFFGHQSRVEFPNYKVRLLLCSSPPVSRCQVHLFFGMTGKVMKTYPGEYITLSQVSLGQNCFGRTLSHLQVMGGMGKALLGLGRFRTSTIQICDPKKKGEYKSRPK